MDATAAVLMAGPAWEGFQLPDEGGADDLLAVLSFSSVGLLVSALFLLKGLSPPFPF